MKRGTPLQRKTPLVNRTPLRTVTPLKPGGPLLRRTPLAPVSQQRRRDNAKRTVVVSAMRMHAEGRCARCSRNDLDVHGHERLRRAKGGDIVHPDCLLCNPCNEWAANNDRIAAWTGWTITPKWPHDPALAVGEAWALDGSRVVFADLAEGVAS